MIGYSACPLTRAAENRRVDIRAEGCPIRTNRRAPYPQPPPQAADTPVSCFVVSEWIGWVSRVRRMLYSRMEELSFRTGAATVAGVMAVAATAILLTLTQGGHHAAPPRAQAGLASSSFVAAP